MPATRQVIQLTDSGNLVLEIEAALDDPIVGFDPGFLDVDKRLRFHSFAAIVGLLGNADLEWLSCRNPAAIAEMANRLGIDTTVNRGHVKCR